LLLVSDKGAGPAVAAAGEGLSQRQRHLSQAGRNSCDPGVAGVWR